MKIIDVEKINKLLTFIVEVINKDITSKIDDNGITKDKYTKSITELYKYINSLSEEKKKVFKDKIIYIFKEGLKNTGIGNGGSGLYYLNNLIYYFILPEDNLLNDLNFDLNLDFLNKNPSDEELFKYRATFYDLLELSEKYNLKLNLDSKKFNDLILIFLNRYDGNNYFDFDVYKLLEIAKEHNIDIEENTKNLLKSKIDNDKIIG